MAKYAGKVGFATQTETSPGVWEDVTVERLMKGDVIRANTTISMDGKVNGDVTFNHRVSLVGASLPLMEYYNIKYITLDGYKWEVKSIEIQRPRIIVTLGGMWNGN